MTNSHSPGFEVEVAYALPEKQMIVPLQVSQGTTAIQAVNASKIAAHFNDLQLEAAKLGVFGKAVKHDQVLREGDRVEIYRPLLVDPKESRRARAAKVKAAG